MDPEAVDAEKGRVHPDSGVDGSSHGDSSGAARVRVGARGKEGLMSAAARLDEQGSFVKDDDESTLVGDDQEAMERARRIVKKFYPTQVQPTMLDFVTSIVEQDDGPWRQGAWVEYLGNDMKWHVAQVKRVIQQAPDSWDWNDPDNEDKEPDWLFFYNVGKATLLPARSIRATEIGLKRLFGSRPWVWQQYALLKFEKFLRFQKDHERDFEEVDSEKWADDLFHEWLEDERNTDFKALYDQYTDETQDLLREHLEKPFVMMDQIVENEEDWDFEDADFSVFSYTSIMGAAGGFTLFCFAIQIVIPIVLLINALEKSERFDASFGLGGWTLDTDWDSFCTGDGNSLGKVMNIAVVLIYLLIILPQQLTKFYRTTGDSESTYSRINSLRMVIWQQRDDSIMQAIGFSLDRNMNTAYVCFLYIVVLFILFNTDEVLDIILNALAADFVHHIDEDIAAEEWFDPEHRFLKAGAVQLVMQANLRLRVLESPSAFCRKFDVDSEKYAEALGSSSLQNFAVASKDDNDNRYKSAEDAQFFLCAEYARSKGNTEAYRQFKKTLTNFSLVDVFVNSCRNNKYGVFHQYVAYRTWSRWDKVLFLADVPEVYDEELGQSFKDIKLSKVIFQTEPHSLQFVWDVLKVLGGYTLYRDVRGVYRRKMYQRIPFQVSNGIINILVYLTQLLFPLVVIAGLWFMPFCY